MGTVTTEPTGPPAATNARIGAALGLTHSAVSRMRRGERFGSVDVWRRIAAATGESLDTVASAAERARGGEVESWASLLLRCAGDQN